LAAGPEPASVKQRAVKAKADRVGLARIRSSGLMLKAYTITDARKTAQLLVARSLQFEQFGITATLRNKLFMSSCCFHLTVSEDENVIRPFNCGRLSSTVLNLSDSTAVAIAPSDLVGCGDGAIADYCFVFHPDPGSRRVDAIAGVMVLSEVVKRLMMMSGPDASTCAAECRLLCLQPIERGRHNHRPSGHRRPGEPGQELLRIMPRVHCPTRKRYRRPRCSGGWQRSCGRWRPLPFSFRCAWPASSPRL
jgi:hypothetical protein